MADAKKMGNGEDPMVLLPVPQQHYATVVRALADALGGNGELRTDFGVSPHVESEGGDKKPDGEWTRDEVRRIKETVRNSSVRALLDLTSERPGEWVSIREVEQRANRTFPQTRADLGGFTKIVKRLFKDHDRKWPFEAAWAVDGEQQYSYRVSDEIARWWREA
jgi:hypothetical protein